MQRSIQAEPVRTESIKSARTDPLDGVENQLRNDIVAGAFEFGSRLII